MGFISVTFLLFLSLVWVTYFVVPLRCRWCVLLGVSLLFYVSYGWEKLIFILLAAVIAYFTAGNIEKIYVNEAEDGKKAKKVARRHLTVGVAFILAMLIYAKVWKWVWQIIKTVFEGEQIGLETVIVPLGISYYTFSIIGYMADVYWKREKAEKNYLKLLLYMSYFPHILQGPIARYKTLAPQLSEGHVFDYKKFCYGLQRIVWGYFKKLVIADRLVVIVNEIFGNYECYRGFYFVFAAILSAIQLYCDFSGCMDITLGISETLSIRLEENFRQPFYAKSAAEFWRRWHITLGSWFKDYVYMPLVISPRVIQLGQKVKRRFGQRAAKGLMSAIPLAVVWLLTGIWHGTGLNYVIWGCYWGVIIIFSTVFAKEIKTFRDKCKIDVERKYYQIFQMVRTFIIFTIGRIITVPGNLSKTGAIIKRMFSIFNFWIFTDGSLYELGISRTEFWLVILALMLLWKVSSMQEQKIDVRAKIASYPIGMRWTIYYACIIGVLVFGMYGSGVTANGFVYANY